MKYQNLEDLLRKNKCPKDKKHTHTRIPNKNLNVFGGSYYIEDSIMPEFWHHYYNKVWNKGLFEYLTDLLRKYKSKVLVLINKKELRIMKNI